MPETLLASRNFDPGLQLPRRGLVCKVANPSLEFEVFLKIEGKMDGAWDAVMPESWNQWEGQVVDAAFPLRKFLGGTSQSAVFLTEYTAANPASETAEGKAAIKLVFGHSQGGDTKNADNQLARWKRAAELSHPHLIRLLHMGRWELDGVPFLYVVMEFADENLAEILPQRALSAPEAGEMLPPVLGALAYLHGQGFAHAALKPSNIMAASDQLKISSDGIVPIGELSYSVPGTNAYGPPEAVRGIISPQGEMSPAGDVWSLGMALVKVLTRALPTWDWGSLEDPAVPTNLPQPFLDIARHCLRRETQRRWTIAQITARMQPGAAPARSEEAPKARTAARSSTVKNKGRYILPAGAVILLVILIFAGQRLRRRDTSAATSTSTSLNETPQVAGSPPDAGAASAAAGTSDAATKTSEAKPTAPPVAPIGAPAGGSAEANRPAPGAVVERVLPDINPSARRTIQGTIRIAIRVSVDPMGNVAMATFDLRGPSGYFADRAMLAARKWKFAPVKDALGYVPVEWLLRFEITPTTTNVFADLGNQ